MMKQVGIIRGGIGNNYTSSLKKGGDIIAHMHENLRDKYKPIDILIDKDGVWHLAGLPIAPVELMHRVDIVWNTSHPNSSIILENFSIPSVGASSSLFENNRTILQEHLKNIGVNMPRHITSPKNAKEVHQKMSPPWIVKFPNEIKIIKTFNELAEVIDGSDGITVEEFIEGRPGAVHSVYGFRNENVYIFPLSSLGNFTSIEKEKIITFAKNLHNHLGAKYYLKSDFILTSRKGIYITNIDFSPDLRQDSHFSDACLSVGAQMHQVVEHILERAIE